MRWLTLRQRFARWLLKGAELELEALATKQLRVGHGSITLSPAGVGDAIRWSAAGPAPAALDLSMAASGVPTWFRAAAVRTGADTDQVGAFIHLNSSSFGALIFGQTYYITDDFATQVLNQAIYIVPKAGMFRNLRARAGANTLNGAATLTLLVNGVASALTVTIPAGSVAQQTDLVNTVNVVAGDEVAFRLVNGGAAGNINPLMGGVEFDYT